MKAQESWHVVCLDITALLTFTGFKNILETIHGMIGDHRRSQLWLNLRLGYRLGSLERKRGLDLECVCLTRAEFRILLPSQLLRSILIR